MSNLWIRFKSLIPSTTLLAGTVVAINTDGTSTVELPDGRIIQAQGQDVPEGDNAFILVGESGVTITGPAPNLPLFTAEV